MAKIKYRIGTAGWSVPAPHKNLFAAKGSHLERYSQVFNAVEINSSFYRDHKGSTYSRWSESVPKDFLFFVKLNKIFTHEQKLKVNEGQLVNTLSGINELGEKFGALLVQLPSSLIYVEKMAHTFFKKLREHYQVAVVFEPRNLSWTDGLSLLEEFNISKVFADPKTCSIPKWEQKSPVMYQRLHGSPQIYKSSYSEKDLDSLAAQMRKASAKCESAWSIFDNTAQFHATTNALDLMKKLDGRDVFDR